MGHCKGSFFEPYVHNSNHRNLTLFRWSITYIKSSWERGLFITYIISPKKTFSPKNSPFLKTCSFLLNKKIYTILKLNVKVTHTLFEIFWNITRTDFFSHKMYIISAICQVLIDQANKMLMRTGLVLHIHISPKKLSPSSKFSPSQNFSGKIGDMFSFIMKRGQGSKLSGATLLIMCHSATEHNETRVDTITYHNWHLDMLSWSIHTIPVDWWRHPCKRKYVYQSFVHIMLI